MRRMVVAVVGVVLALGAVGLRAQTPDTDTWAKLIAANDLDLKGNQPFHLGMTLQLYDLQGKPTETGSFEEWWAAPGSERTVVHLAGLNEDGTAPEGADAALVRDSYLVRQLMQSAAHPVPTAGNATQELVTRTQKFGKTPLECTSPKGSDRDDMNAKPGTICVAPHTTDAMVLLGLGGKESLLRARTGKFHDTYVALDLRLGYLGQDAIAGKLTIMQAFDPAKSDVKLPLSTGPKPGAVAVTGEVIAGHRIKFTEPAYPMAAKMQHIGGTVVLSAIIGKDGSVERLVPIARTAPMFSDAAMDGVKKWTYLPYLLNGEPTEVDTTITVNFAIKGP